MELKYILFLEALRAALNNSKAEWKTEPDRDTLMEILRLSLEHNVFPLVFMAIYKSPSVQSLGVERVRMLKKRTLQFVALQTKKTDEFLKVLNVLTENGVTPLVMKGLVCRNIYPNPNLRQSGDEDILIPPEQIDRCSELLIEYGLELKEPGKNIHEAHEVPYGSQDSSLYIEVHKYPFPPGNVAYGEMNSYFSDVFKHGICETIHNVKVPTLCYTDHLFYLICHAFKHFLHSGIGIRQICDICMYANTYGNKIDWNDILLKCREIKSEKFSAAIFAIGANYLNFDADRAGMTDEWKNIKVDEADLLYDILNSGSFGTNSGSRAHSSNITLNAVVAENRGETAKHSVLKTVFPPIAKLTGRYPFLKKHPYLLPIAWIMRIFRYLIEISNSGAKNKASDSIKIGNERIELLKEYGIIGKR